MDEKREPFSTVFRGYDKDEVLLYLKKQVEGGTAEKKEQERLEQAYQQLEQAYGQLKQAYLQTEQAGRLCESEKQQMSARTSRLQMENKSLLQEVERITLQAKLAEGDAVIQAVTDIPGCDEEEQEYAKSAMAWIAYKIKQIQQAEGKTREKCDRMLEEAEREAARIEREGALKTEQRTQAAQRAWQGIVGILIEMDGQIGSLLAKEREYSQDVRNIVQVLHDGEAPVGKEIEGSCDAVLFHDGI